MKFPLPPAGFQWANPERYTPGRIEVDKGYRLLLLGETIQKGDEYYPWPNLENDREWYETSSVGEKQLDTACTRRTKRPLPDYAKPAPSERETFLVIGPDSVHGKTQQWFFAELELAVMFAEQAAKDMRATYTVAKRIGLMRPVVVEPSTHFTLEEDL